MFLLIVKSLISLISYLQSQLTGDSGEVYLFQWLASAERFLRTAPPVCFHVYFTRLTTHRHVGGRQSGPERP